jgi:phage/plasmid-associated DNA primase
MDNMIDSKTLRVSDLDVEFIATKSKTLKSKNDPERALVRHNWLELFVRLCQTKYMRNKADPSSKTWSECFATMLNHNLLPYFKRFNSHAWRQKHCWTEEIDLVLKRSLP